MNILVSCTGGGVGDVLATLPAIRALNRQFGVRVDMLTTPYAAPILRGQAPIGHVLLDDGKAPVRELVQQLKERSYSHAIVFWSNPRVATAITQAGIPERIGQSRRLYSFRYTKRVPVRTELGDTHSHWTDVQMDYVRAIGVKPIASDYEFEIPVTHDDDIAADAVLRKLGVRDRFILYHAVRGVSPQSAHWPSETFAALGDALALEFSTSVVLTGSASDSTLVQSISSCMNHRAYNAAGLTTLRALAALARRSLMVVALDSGPMHVGAAAGAPTVGIFALSTDLPRRWRPLGPRVAVVEPSYPCPRACRKETCRTFACYAALPIPQVLQAARSVAPVLATQAAF